MVAKELDTTELTCSIISPVRNSELLHMQAQHFILKCLLGAHLVGWASLVAQLVKNLPAMPETWVPSLD